MKYAPPSGSAVSVVPASVARICCVRRAIVAARSVGSASASSKEFVWSDCAPPQHGRERLDRHADDVVLGLLRGQRRAAGLRVEAERQRAWVGRAEAVAHDLGPQAPRRAELRDLLEEVVVGVEEEGEALAEVVRGQAGGDRRLAVGDSVRERERELLRGARSGLADVVPGDRDRVEAGDPLGAVGEEICREPHRRPRREDVVAARDVLLQHVVLHGAAQRGPRDALLLGDELVQEEQERGRRVDRHRGGDAVERDALEQHLHVRERVDRDPRAADLALGERVVGVVAELGREVERDREAGLTALEEVAEARVRLLGRPVARVLANRPRAAAVHRLVRAARERVRTGKLELALSRVRRRVDRLDLDAGVGQPAVGAVAIR